MGTATRARIQSAARSALLAVPLLLLLGTSRPLRYKVLAGTVTKAPAALAATGAQAFFGEDVDNQGCNAPQRLDLAARVTVTNHGAVPLHIDEAGASFVVDGAHIAWRERKYWVGGEESALPAQRYDLAPGATAVVTVTVTSVLPVASLDADTVDCVIATCLGAIVLHFGGLRSVPLREGENLAEWE